MKQVLSLNYALIIAKADAFELNHPSTIFTDDDIEVITPQVQRKPKQS